MKTSKLTFLICLIVFVASSFSMQVQAKAISKDTETQTRKTESFHAIKVSTGIDLYLEQGDVEKITVEADDDIIDDLKTVVKDGVLKIYMEKNFNWEWNTTKKVFVTVRELDMLNASSGSDVESKGIIQVKTLKVDASSGSDIELEVNAENLYVNTSSGSDAELKGTTEYLEASSSSGSDLEAAELKSKICKVSASSGSDATVYVSESIKANASSGADIRYSGNPSAKDIDESSGGDVYKK